MGLHEFAQDDAALKARLDAAVDRLTEELDGIDDRETIRGVVEESARELSGKSVTPFVRAAMEEVGIDLSEAYTKPLTSEVLAGADVVVTMGRSVGPVAIPPTVKHADWRVGDPAGAPLEEVRRVRDDIERRVDALVDELVPARESEPAPAF